MNKRKIIKSINDAKIDDNINAKLKDGSFDINIKKIN